MDGSEISFSLEEILELFLGAGLVAGIGAALVNQLFSWFRHWHQEKASVKKEARYLAIRVAVMLEKFAIDCAELVGDNRDHSSSRGAIGRVHDSLPILHDYPDDIDWKAIDADLLSRILSIGNEIFLAERWVSGWYDIDRDCVQNACDKQAAVIGCRAWTLAKELREQYGLPQMSGKIEKWDFIKFLQEVRDEQE